MVDSRPRQDLLRIAGFGGILFFALLILQMITYRIAGANIYTENDWLGTFNRILEHRSIYTLSCGAGALAAVCTIPMMLGFFQTVEPADRPIMWVACGFLFLSVLLIVDAYAHAGNLVGTSEDYLHGLTTPDVLIALADQTQGDQYQILQYAGFFSFGIGTLMVTWLMTRSAFYVKPIAWLTFSVAMTSFLANIAPSLFIADRLIWVFGLGVVWITATLPSTEEETEAAIA
jgi:hypothetical protein